MSANLYDTDHAAWLHQQAELLKSGRLTSVDAAHLIEELEAEVGNYERELNKRLLILLMHLLKWKYQPDQRSSSWRGTIRVQRKDIGRLLKRNPSLKRLIEAEIEDAYPDAVDLAAYETSLLQDAFPASCEWSEAEILNPDFWPD